MITVLLIYRRLILFGKKEDAFKGAVYWEFEGAIVKLMRYIWR